MQREGLTERDWNKVRFARRRVSLLRHFGLSLSEAVAQLWGRALDGPPYLLPLDHGLLNELVLHLDTSSAGQQLALVLRLLQDTESELAWSEREEHVALLLGRLVSGHGEWLLEHYQEAPSPYAGLLAARLAQREGLDDVPSSLLPQLVWWWLGTPEHWRYQDWVEGVERPGQSHAYA